MSARLTREQRRARALVIFGAVVLVPVMVVLLFVFLRDLPSDTPVREGEVAVAEPEPGEPEVTDWPVPTPSVAQSAEVYTPGDGSFVFPGTVPLSNPDAVAEAFAELTVSWDTATDMSQAAGLERALPLAAPELEVPPPAQNVGAAWIGAAEELAYTVPNAEVVKDAYVGPQPVYEPTGEAIMPYTLDVSYKWQDRLPGEDGELGVSEPESRSVFLSLVERGGEWEVVEYGYVEDTPAA